MDGPHIDSPVGHQRHYRTNTLHVHSHKAVTDIAGITGTTRNDSHASIQTREPLTDTHTKDHEVNVSVMLFDNLPLVTEVVRENQTNYPQKKLVDESCRPVFRKWRKLRDISTNNP